MTLAPVIDHVVVNVHRAMDEAADTWRRLGFTLTPRGHHSLGSINHLAIFATDYLELIGLPAAGGGRADLLDWARGLNGLVFQTENADDTHAAAVAAGLAPLPVQSFTRPVDLGATSRDAAFRTVRLPPDTTIAGRLYWCEHRTRDLVWRDDWRRHANGAQAVAGFTIAATDPDRLARLFRALFGADRVRPIEGGHRLVAGLANIDLLSRPALEHRFGAAAPADDGRPEIMAALTLRTTALDAAAAIAAPGLIREPGRVLVPASAAGGATLEFVATP